MFSVIVETTGRLEVGAAVVLASAAGGSDSGSDAGIALDRIAGDAGWLEMALGFGLAVMLALVHILAHRLTFLRAIPRSRWLSTAGGASVAYVFVHVLPELSRGQEELARNLGPMLAALEHHVYLVALAGFSAFYGLDRLARRHHPRRKREADETEDDARQDDHSDENAASRAAFWLHIGSFTIYNLLIGYLLLDRLSIGLTSVLLFSIAMGLHFVVNDHGLREHHQTRYHNVGRWLLGGGVTVGYGISLFYTAPEWAIALVFALIAGGVILNVIKEELPEERESRFWTFVVGAVVYAALLVVMAGQQASSTGSGGG